MSESRLDGTMTGDQHRGTAALRGRSDLQEEYVMLAELTIIPIGTGPHLRDQLADIVGIVDESGLPYLLTPSGTCIEGEWDDVMDVVHRCHDKARQKASHVQTLISIEDEKNAKNKLRANVEGLEKKIGHPLRREH
jgi:uncharacterized protein (TIGR00106 family)